jgi:hypothetical protein
MTVIPPSYFTVMVQECVPTESLAAGWIFHVVIVALAPMEEPLPLMMKSIEFEVTL